MWNWLLISFDVTSEIWFRIRRHYLNLNDFLLEMVAIKRTLWLIWDVAAWKATIWVWPWCRICRLVKSCFIVNKRRVLVLFFQRVASCLDVNQWIDFLVSVSKLVFRHNLPIKPADILIWALIRLDRRLKLQFLLRLAFRPILCRILKLSIFHCLFHWPHFDLVK